MIGDLRGFVGNVYLPAGLEWLNLFQLVSFDVYDSLGLSRLGKEAGQTGKESEADR